MVAVSHAAGLGRRFVGFGSELVRSRRLVVELARREFRARYLGSAFGLTWAFIHPAVMMAIYAVVFRYILRVGPVGGEGGTPFIVWLLSGQVVWYVASEGMGSSTTAITDNRFLVKRVVFRVSLLPVVRLLTLVPVHLFFVVVVTLICWANGRPPSWYTLQVFYYMAALMLLGVGWSWLVSALVPFLKDLAQFVAVIAQLLFWVTPLLWPIRNVPDRFLWIAALNPLTYVVEGYRDSLVNHVPFWHHPLTGPYYWAWTTMFLAVGGVVFLRLRGHFADVL